MTSSNPVTSQRHHLQIPPITLEVSASTYQCGRNAVQSIAVVNFDYLRAIVRVTYCLPLVRQYHAWFGIEVVLTIQMDCLNSFLMNSCSTYFCVVFQNRTFSFFNHFIDMKYLYLIFFLFLLAKKMSVVCSHFECNPGIGLAHSKGHLLTYVGRGTLVPRLFTRLLLP